MLKDVNTRKRAPRNAVVLSLGMWSVRVGGNKRSWEGAVRRRVDFYSKEREEPTLPLLACFLNANHIASVKVKRTLGMDPCSAGRKPACVTSLNSISEFQLHAGGVDENPQTPDFVQFAGSKS